MGDHLGKRVALNPAWGLVAGLVLIGSITSLSATPTAPPAPTPTGPTALTPPPAPATGRAYGVGLSGDSRNNKQLNSPLSYRFRASTTSPAVSFRVQQRGGTVYSKGNGGTIRASLQADVGGKPSGSPLASLTFNPGNPGGNWEVWTKLTFPTPTTLTKGQRYHLVFENLHSDPANNYISLNCLFTYGGATNVAFGSDFAALYGSGWAVQGKDIPIFDLAYADGTHDGMSYIGALIDKYGVISGSSNMVRERFTVSGGNRTITSANVKVKRISGTSPLTITLEKGDGTFIESVTIPASSIPLGILPTGAGASDLAGNTWASAKFRAASVLTNGQTYNLRLVTAADTKYIAVPVQEGTDKGLESYRFTDGDGQYTTNGGSSWANLYQWEPVDLQFYLQQ